MNNSITHYSGPEIDKFNEISDKLDEILVDLEKDQVLNILINYMANGLLKCSDEPFKEVEFWANSFAETLKIHANNANGGSIQ